MPMMLSRERILTTHVGSLPRNDELSDLLIQREEGEPVDMDRLRQAMDRAVEDVVKKQMTAGRHRHRKRWRAAAYRFFNVYGAAHVGFRRRIQAAAGARP